MSHTSHTPQPTNQSSQTNKEANQDQNKFRPENEEQSFWYISKKTEKLMTAVYMLTDFLSDNEPMKGRLREYALAVLADIHSLGHLVLSERKNTAKKILGNTESILSFLEIASSVGLISVMNVRVLKDECRDVEEMIRAHIFTSDENAIFSRNFFLLPEGNRQNSQVQKDIQKDKGQDLRDAKNTLGTLEKVQTTGDQKYQKYPHTNLRNTTNTETISRIKDKEKEDSKGDVSENMTAMREVPEVLKESNVNHTYMRRENILKILKENSDATIKDILKKLPGMGEKTLQRELVSFIAAGLVKKTGERRWSRYSLR